ncbi:hypothetical protein EG68_02093 [Paragonimus skrjabini miyazakii]|uniref:TRAFD1/XAF1 zinc finger domain-containing protein n=1 Tax=Paragonimus skrjabini miyazakii TaxID=59628 RepID=A0A8S9YYV3_9TREM|nr:hypothetical protein EG68_02093 [Paragonimus skrjabini miyazakii]
MHNAQTVSNGDVFATNFAVHEAYCIRNLTRCTTCNDIVLKKNWDEHLQKEHSLVKCEMCGNSLMKFDLPTHMDTCNYRPVTCHYCQIVIPTFSLCEHLEQCGCRTERCDRCKKYVMIRNLETHSCFFKPQPKSDEAFNKGDNIDSDFDLAIRLQCIELESEVPSTSLSEANSQSCATKDGINTGLFHAPIYAERPIRKTKSDELVPCPFCPGSYGVDQIATHQIACLSTISPTSLPNKSLGAQQRTQRVTVESQAKSSNAGKAELIPPLRLPKTTTSKSVASDVNDKPVTLVPIRPPCPTKSRRTTPSNCALPRVSASNVGRNTATDSSVSRTYELPPLRDPTTRKRREMVHNLTPVSSSQASTGVSRPFLDSRTTSDNFPPVRSTTRRASQNVRRGVCSSSSLTVKPRPCRQSLDNPSGESRSLANQFPGSGYRLGSR